LINVNRRGAWIVALVALLLSACSAPATTSNNPGITGEAPRSQPSGPKILTIGIEGELPDFYGFGGIRGGGITHIPNIALDTLVVQNDKGEYQPLLASEQLSFDRGTWVVNPDGTMDTTWKLRPNIKWHDGTPFTSADMMFTLAVRKDPAVGARNFGRLDLVQSATAPDPQTFVIHWSAPYVDANQALDLEPMPKHLLEDVYLNQKESFQNSSQLTTQFIGQGPYRLAEWQSGSHMVFTRFDDYYQGRPPLDRVIVRTLGDPNTMVSNILAGTVDILLPRTVELDAAVEVKRRWEGTGNVVRFDLDDSLQHIEIQFRPEVARPREGLTNLTVRKALYHGIDRQTFVEVITSGIAPIADSWVAPSSALRPALESKIPQYPYDPTRAQQMLTSAGWVKGADGVLVHNSTGERFETELYNSAAPQQVSVVASQWKQLGVLTTETTVPASRSGDREFGAAFLGGFLTSVPTPQLYSGKRLHSTVIRSAATRWVGENRSGYANPRVDVLLDRAVATVDPKARMPVLADLVEAEFADVAIMPLFWAVSPVLQVKGVKSHVTAAVTTWNFYDFDKDPS
jgi:peptide/nickel transport system substrate-binding protein